MEVRCSSCGNKVSTTDMVCNVCAVKTALSDKSKGKWEINPDGYYPECSVCGYEPRIDHSFDLCNLNYCPKCGSVMAKFELTNIKERNK